MTLLAKKVPDPCYSLSHARRCNIMQSGSYFLQETHPLTLVLQNYKMYT